MEIDTNDSVFRSVGRYTLLGFKNQSPEPTAVINFVADTDCLAETAHSRMGVEENVIELRPSALAVLVDSMPNGPEHQYLDTVHRALEALTSVNFTVVDIFKIVSRNMKDTLVGPRIEAKAVEAMAVLEPLYKRPTSRPPFEFSP